MSLINHSLENTDSDILKVIKTEAKRQEEHLELIASENYVSTAVLEAQGSILTNKYAEGYPSKRYYGGCEFVDQAEALAIERACDLFKADCANVQPNSGSQANQAAFMALIKPGDTILGMSLSMGGHLTHGSPVNQSGRWFNVIPYGLNEQEEIGYTQVEELAKKHQPKLIIAGASAYALKIDFERMSHIAKSCGAFLMSDVAHYAGLIVAGLYPNPVPYSDVVTSTTHKTLRGPRGGLILMKQEHEKAINSAIFPGMQGGPLMHTIAAKAVSFKEAGQPQFITYQKQVLKNATTMAKVLADRGLRIVSGKTESHLVLLDLKGHSLSGKEAEALLGQANITVNKNAVPNDPRSPFITSGLRIGTPAMTTRGMKETEATVIANTIADIIQADQPEAKTDEAKVKIVNLCNQYPVYG